MRPVVTLALGLALALPAAAMADCPGPGDLARGITLTYRNGDVETFREIRPGLVAVIGKHEGDGYSLTTLAQGFHLLDTRDVDDPEKSAISYDYGMPADALPVPEPGATWTFDTVVTAANGPFEQVQTQTYGEPTHIEIGSCGYTAIEGQISYETATNVTEGIVYIRELGFGYLRWRESDTRPRGWFRAVAIRTGR